MIIVEKKNSNYDSYEDTMNHKEKVKNYIHQCIKELGVRAISHDDSKLGEIEKPLFDEYTPKLQNLTYGSQEYKDCLKKMGVAIEHHHKENRHHPEYFENGIKDMNLIDLIELVADWYAASQRHADGDIRKSIEINKERFGYDDLMASILSNTIDFIKELE